MWRRSVMSAVGVFRGLHSASSAVRSTAMPPSPALLNSIIRAPRISPLVTPAQIMPPSRKPEIELPYLRYKEITLPNLGIKQSPLEEPTAPTNTTMYCNMIQIRKRKMKKHKLKKLRKRMRFLWAKERYRREKNKEQLFKAELLAKIREGEEFNAEQYVKSVLQTIRDRDRGIETPEQRRERIEDLRRKYRSNVSWVKPKLDLD